MCLAILIKIFKPLKSRQILRTNKQWRDCSQIFYKFKKVKCKLQLSYLEIQILSGICYKKKWQRKWNYSWSHWSFLLLIAPSQLSKSLLMNFMAQRMSAVSLRSFQISKKRMRSIYWPWRSPIILTGGLISLITIG